MFYLNLEKGMTLLDDSLLARLDSWVRRSL